MNQLKKRKIESKFILLSLIPIFGCIMYSFHLFLQDSKKYLKSAIGMVLGMLSFMLIYGGFAIICNTTALDLNVYEWLVWLLLYISGVTWNVVFFMILHKMNCI